MTTNAHALMTNVTATLSPPLDEHLPLACWSNESDYWIGHSEADVALMYFANGGESHMDSHDWIMVGNDCEVAIETDDERGVVRKTVGEWIADDGRGFLCSEDL